MVVYNHTNFNLLNYIARDMRVYCCGVDASDTASWVRGLYIDGSVYHYYYANDDYYDLDSDDLVNEMTIMEHSLVGVFFIADTPSAMQTLLLMGYSIMCSGMRGIVCINTTDTQMMDTARSFDMHICHTIEEVNTYITTWIYRIVECEMEKVNMV